MKDISLKVVLNDQVVFQSCRNWIYPIFDLEHFLIDHTINMACAKVYDKVVGKAAALLFLRLAVGSVHGEVMSELALNVFTQSNVNFTFGKLVKKIDCHTEEILSDVDDPNKAYYILCKRVKQGR